MIALCQFVGRKKFSTLLVEMDLLDADDVPDADDSECTGSNRKKLNYEVISFLRILKFNKKI